MKHALALAALLTATALPAFASNDQPVRVVELFTSQGCSSCPPANKMVVELVEDAPDTLALSYGVTYWDYLGWKDTFGDPAFTERQRSYGKSLPSQVYTPQVVVNGEAHAPRWKRRKIDAHVLDVSTLTIGADGRLSGELPHGTALALVRYTPGTQDVAVKRGENHGRTMRLANVVTGIDYAVWNGPMSVDVGDGALAVLAHDDTGRVIAAARIEP